MKVQLDRDEFVSRYPTPGALAKALLPSTRQTPALDAIDAALVDLAQAESDIGRQMVFIPPQEGKSTRVSCWYPLWLLAQDPTLRIMIVSYAENKAVRWGRWLRRMIEAHPELGIELRSDSRAVDNWETTAGGGVVSLGISGGATGLPADYMIIDDPLRGRAEAESPTYRDNAWDWWESNGSTRLSSRGKVCLTLTRWHKDDLAGRLIDHEPGRWKVLRIPAVREEGHPPVRGADGASVYSPQGELISVQGRRPGYYLELKQRRSLYVWNSIYMQTPVAVEGNLFHRPDFRYWTPLGVDRDRHDITGGQRIYLPDLSTRIYLDDCWRFITADLAASTATSADWTVAAVWALTADGHLILLDRARERIDESAHWDLIRPLTERWSAPDVFVEKGFIGSTLMIDATRAGMRVQGVTPDRDKITRALPATYRVKQHLVWWPSAAPWLDEWCDELAEFPNAAHDDIVDAFAYAVRVTSAHWLPQDLTPRVAGPAAGDPAQEAYRAATGFDDATDYRY